jgi:hypothetical protein
MQHLNGLTNNGIKARCKFPIMVSHNFVSLKSHSCGSRACPALDAGNPVFSFWIPTSRLRGDRFTPAKEGVGMIRQKIYNGYILASCLRDQNKHFSQTKT